MSMLLPLRRSEPVPLQKRRRREMTHLEEANELPMLCAVSLGIQIFTSLLRCVLRGIYVQSNPLLLTFYWQ